MPNLFIHNNPKYIVNNNKTIIETTILSQANTQPTQPSSSDILPTFSLILPVFFIGIFATVFGLIGFAIFKGISTAIHNSKQPIIYREAKVVSKRQHVSGGAGDSSTSTSYYITFEFTDGSREELGLSGREYALIAEGDKGTLHSQGSWFKDFKRQF